MPITKPSATKTAATAATAKKPAAANAGIVAYCVKTKEKNVPMLKAVIDVSNNRYIAKGVDAKGNKLTAIMSKDSAEGHVAAGRAKKGEGWS